jgi:exosortase K
MTTAQFNRNLPCYILTAGIFFLLKLYYTSTDNHALAFLLSPTNKLVALLTGSATVPLATGGFYYPEQNVCIEKSCAGFNFWMLSFALLTYLVTLYETRASRKYLSIPAMLATTYLLTLLVNTSRIYVSIIVRYQAKRLPASQQHLIHESIGIFIHLGFLVIVYYLAEKLLNHQQQHAKHS